MATRGDAPEWLRETQGAVLVSVHLQPGARRSALLGEHGGRLKIAIAAPPIEGRANDALIEWLAGLLDVPLRQVSVVAGPRSRDKVVRVGGIDKARALGALDRERLVRS